MENLDQHLNTPEEKARVKTNIMLKQGAIMGLSIVIVSLLFLIFELGFSTKIYMKIINLLLTITIFALFLYFALKNYKNLYTYVSFGQAFKICMGAVAVAAIIITIYSYASVYIFPEYYEKIKEFQLEQALATPNITKEAIAMIEKQNEMLYFTPSVIAVMTLGASLFMGMIYSLIVAAVMKKDDPNDLKV